MNSRNFGGTFTVLAACLACQAALAVDLELNLSPDDFARTRIYSVTATSTAYTEAVDFTTAAGTISPGDSIDIRVNLLKSILMENHFSGAPFTVTMLLTAGSPPPTFVHTLSTSLTLPGAENVDVSATVHSGWTSILNMVHQSAYVGVSPSDVFARLSTVHWQYSAPSWSPAGVDVNLLVSFGFVRASHEPFPDPGHNLVTFVPEPSSAALAAILWPLVVIARRRR